MCGLDSKNARTKSQEPRTKKPLNGENSNAGNDLRGLQWRAEMCVRWLRAKTISLLQSFVSRVVRVSWAAPMAITFRAVGAERRRLNSQIEMGRIPKRLSLLRRPSFCVPRHER